MIKSTALKIFRSRILYRQDGFTMMVTLGVMLVTSLLLLAAFTSANGEVHLTSTDTAAKKAYYAAEAGIEDYEYHLTQDGNYLSYCTTPTPANPALNQLYKEGGATKVPLKTSELSTAEVPGSGTTSSEEKYAIQLLPAGTDVEKEDPAEPKWKTIPHCDKNRLVESMIEEKEGPAAGTFRIMSTGFSGSEKRTIVATLRNANFVSYVWYSVYETGDPTLYGEVPKEEPTTYWDECGHFYTERPARCSKFNNYFIGGESVNGPMHTQDHVGICGEPVFGRSHSDRIEFGNGYKKTEKEGYSNESCGEPANPNFVGTQVPPSEVLQITPPPGDEELEHIVEDKYHYVGKTEIALEGTTMSVSKWTENAKGELVKETTSGVAFPPNGVIYVSGECGKLYSPFGPSPEYAKDNECANAYVHGKYEKALTIATQNDIVINGNITTPLSEGKPSGNAMLGLIANNFVRVYHPVAERYLRSGSKCKEETYEGHKILDQEVASSNPVECEYTNEALVVKNGSEYTVVDACDAPNLSKAEGELENPEIYAAILALNHSFIVDNFDCGKPNLGSLNVYGAIAGEFTNGMTGVFSGKTPLSGYPYNLQYDSRLQAEEPPHFLNPIEAAWYIQRQTLAPFP
jgi:Tfp pilus assembly protein PilX